MARRIQRRRTKGWRMPPGAVYVGRPSKWGNKFTTATSGSAQQAVDDFRYWMGMDADAPEHFGAALRARAVAELAGMDLVCWCPLSAPCHADVLLEVANYDPDPCNLWCGVCQLPKTAAGCDHYQPRTD